MGFRITGQQERFCVTADSKYYKNKINAYVEHLLYDLGGIMVTRHKSIVKIRYVFDKEKEILATLLKLLQHFKIKYTLAIGPVIVYKNENDFVVTGYVKQSALQAFSVYRAAMHYSGKNEEFYAFPLQKYDNVIRIFEKCGVGFTEV